MLHNVLLDFANQHFKRVKIVSACVMMKIELLIFYFVFVLLVNIVNLSYKCSA